METNNIDLKIALSDITYKVSLQEDILKIHNFFNMYLYSLHNSSQSKSDTNCLLFSINLYRLKHFGKLIFSENDENCKLYEFLKIGMKKCGFCLIKSKPFELQKF